MHIDYAILEKFLCGIGKVSFIIFNDVWQTSLPHLGYSSL